MNEFKTLAAADSLISHVTGEPLEIGRARSLTQYGRLEVCFDYRGKIGLFPIIAINGNSVPHAILFPVPEKTCYFVGVLKSKSPPLLDNKRLRITYASETNLKTHHRFVADVLNPHAVLIAFTKNIDPAMPDQPPAGFYWGRVLSEFKRDSQVIRPATIDKSEVSESNWRISSDEIRALFKNTDTPNALPDANDPAVGAVTPAPVDEVALMKPEKVGPKFNMTKAAMVAQHVHEWPTIARDITDASENGLAAAKAGRRGWYEPDAMAWARANNKLVNASKSFSALTQGVNKMLTVPGRKHTLEG